MSAGMPLVAGPTGGIFAISPDGSRIVATQRGTDKVLRLYTRLLDQNQLIAMPGTENASTPFFSPDGQWVGFEAQGKLKKVAISGGAPIVLCDAPNIRGASWGDDGHIVFTPNPGANLLRVPESGGTPTALTQLGHNDRTHRWPEVLPGSQTAIFTLSPSAVYDDGWIELVSLKTGQRKTLYRGGQAPHFVVGTQGPRILFVNRNRLFALAFDTSRMEVTGAPVPVLENVSTHIAAGGLYAVSRNGTLVFMEGTAQHGLWTLDWLDASGETELLHGPPSNYFTPRLSPDGAE